MGCASSKPPQVRDEEAYDRYVVKAKKTQQKIPRLGKLDASAIGFGSKQVATLTCIEEESAPPCVASTKEPLISPPLSPAGPLSLASSFTSIATRENSWNIGVSRQVSCCDPSICPELAAQLQQEEQQGEEQEEAEQQVQLCYEDIEEGRSTTSDLPSASHIGLESSDALSTNSSCTSSCRSLMAAEQQHSECSEQLHQVQAEEQLQQVQAEEQRQEPQAARPRVAKAAKAWTIAYLRTGSYPPSCRAPTSAPAALHSATLAPDMLPRHQPGHLTSAEILSIVDEVGRARNADTLERDTAGNLALGSFLLHQQEDRFYVPLGSTVTFTCLHTSQAYEATIERELGFGTGGVLYEVHVPAFDDSDEGSSASCDGRFALKVCAPYAVTSMDAIASGECDLDLAREVAVGLVAGDLPSGQSSTLLTMLGYGLVGGLVPCLLLPLAHRSLSDEIQSQGPVGLRSALLRLWEVARGAAALHSAGLLHGDIKSENVLRMRDGRLRLGDFGLTVPLEWGKAWGLRGTLGYNAPEMAGGGGAAGYTASVDIWAIGVVLVEMLTGLRGWDIERVMAAERWRDEGCLLPWLQRQEALWGLVPQVVRPLLAQMLCVDAQQRVSAAGVVQQVEELLKQHGWGVEK